MKKTKIIGLTGGIASGKSSVAEFLRARSFPVFDADKAAHELMSKDSGAWQDIIDEFGKGILTNSEEIDRQKLGQIVFAEPERLKKLEAILHHRIWQAFENFCTEQRAQQAKIVFLDAPLLIEAGWHERVDSVWLVYLSREEQIRRAMQRDKVQAVVIEQRLDKQMSFDKKKLVADRIIDNSFTLEQTYAQVESLINELQVAI